MKLAIKKHWVDFLAIAGLAILGTAIGVYILNQQSLRFPLVQEKPKQIKIELSNAQAVQPGQGQTVRVAGVEVGRIADVKLEDGIAVVTLDIEKDYENLIRRDATALLRPKTALKDMFLEVNPGTGKAVSEGGRITVANSLPDIDPDEVYAALDADTRPYLKLLVAGAGKGLREPRGRPARGLPPLRADPPRPGPGHEGQRGAPRSAQGADPRLRPADDRARQPPAGPAPARDRFAQRVRRAGGRGRPRSPRPWPSCRRRCGPPSGRSPRSSEFAPVLRSSLESLRKPIRKLPETNEAVIPFLKQTEPVIRTQIRPFVRAARPWTDDLRLAAEGTAKAMPDLRRSFGELNRFFNIGAYNPGGAEGLDGKSISQQRQRQEGFLYWLAWVSQNGSSLFSSADGQGPWRRVTICGVPAAALTGIVNGVIGDISESNPELADQLTGITSPGGSSAVDQLLATQFGSCNFNALPSTPPPGSGGGGPILPLPPIPPLLP